MCMDVISNKRELKNLRIDMKSTLEVAQAIRMSQSKRESRSNDKLMSFILEKEISLRLDWIKSMFDREMSAFVSAYGLGSEKREEI